MVASAAVSVAVSGRSSQLLVHVVIEQVFDHDTNLRGGCDGRRSSQGLCLRTPTGRGRVWMCSAPAGTSRFTRRCGCDRERVRVQRGGWRGLQCPVPGVWLSWLERCLHTAEVTGSSPVTPTTRDPCNSGGSVVFGLLSGLGRGCSIRADHAPRIGERSSTIQGSMRSTVSTRSIERSNEATRPTPVLSAHATRYVSAKSSRSVS